MPACCASVSYSWPVLIGIRTQSAEIHCERQEFYFIVLVMGIPVKILLS